MSVRYLQSSSSSKAGSMKGKEDEHPMDSIDDDHLFIAVGKSLKENKSTVTWALQNSGGKKICILHVHTLAQTKSYLRYASKDELAAYNEEEKKEMLKTLDKYIQLCVKEGVNAEKTFIEGNSIEEGIIALISQKRIGRLVMGAAADNRYNKKMKEVKSSKAIYVQSHAPASCTIWFVCKGHCIYTREGNVESGETNSLRSLSRTESVMSEIIPHNNLVMDNGSSIGTSSDLVMDNGSSVGTSSDLVMASPLSSHGSDTLPRTNELDEEKVMGGDELYDQLEKAMEEAYVESVKRRKAEKETVEATRRAKTIENLYYEEQKRKKEVDEKLVEEMKECQTIKEQYAKVLVEYELVLHQKSSLERENEKANLMVKELDEKILSSVALLDKYKKERDEFKTDLDNALRDAELLRTQLTQMDTATTQVSRFFADFSYVDILEATDTFNVSRKIGEGGFGDTYKGFLRHVEVAIKVPSSNSLQAPQEFQQEVDALSKLRHPNIVTLIGVCSEASALIYEYLPNGNLDDRLACKDNTPPLTWQARIRIATELCSVLMFLHSCQPESVIHGDIKPSNVLLDAHLSCKLSDFGICRKMYNGEGPTENMTRFYRTDPKGTFAYIDPEFLSSGELTPKSDVYSFGIILLRLLTGKSAFGIIKEVQNALDKDNLNTILDTSAGNWPFVQAKQLALLGLRCCELQRKNRPSIEVDVWRVLAPMRISSQCSSFVNLGHDEYDHVPPYFMCPIFQEVMQDPHIATDGFTYEAEALKGWLESGHDTSPMTNLKLQNHTLIPNRGLRSAIQEWIQQRSIT